MFEFEEYHTPKRAVWGWVILIALSAFLIAWGMLIHMLCPDMPVKWDFGQADDTPSASKYSTQEPVYETNVPLQIDPAVLEKQKYKK
jgi:hypothetical protein